MRVEAHPSTDSCKINFVAKNLTTVLLKNVQERKQK